MIKFLIYSLLFSLIAMAGFVLSPFAREIILKTGMANEEIAVSGTGSMYPSFPKSEGVSEEAAGEQVVASPEMRRYPGGITLFGKTYFAYGLKRGDIVEFENPKTADITEKKYGRESGFVKRVIAVGGDEIELRDGNVYINGRVKDEPYTAKPQSTYGGDFLPDCKKVRVPDDSVFVMGDNRKASLDSRFELGFVDVKSINYVMPWDMQQELMSKWRSPDEDNKKDIADIDPEIFVKLLNEYRRSRKVTEIRTDPKLNNSARLRGEVILETDDFSVEATKSGMTLKKAMDRSGYGNIISAEAFAQGFFEAEELLENFFEFPDTRKLLLSGEYQDIGMSAVKKDVHDCPTRISVVHLGGYKPPDYPQEDVESWKGLIANLEQVLPSWESLKDADRIDRVKVQTLVGLLNTRLANARRIYARLSANQWLTGKELDLVALDSKLHQEAENLILQLNAQN